MKSNLALALATHSSTGAGSLQPQNVIFLFCFSSNLAASSSLALQVLSNTNDIYYSLFVTI